MYLKGETSQDITNNIHTRSEKLRPKITSMNQKYPFPYYLKGEVPISPHTYTVGAILAGKCHREEKLGMLNRSTMDRELFSLDRYVGKINGRYG